MCVFEVSNDNGVILNELLKNFFKTEFRTNINGKETIQIIGGKTEKDTIILDKAIIDSYIVQDQGRSLWTTTPWREDIPNWKLLEFNERLCILLWVYKVSP